MVATEAQAESVLYGDTGALSVVSVGTSIILCSTASPGYVTHLGYLLLKDGSDDLKLIDAPVSGGVIRAADGTLTPSTQTINFFRSNHAVPTLRNQGKGNSERAATAKGKQ